MNFTQTETEILLLLWENVKGGLSKVAEHIENGTFHTPPDTKGACPPSQAGQMVMWFAIAIDAELTKRGVKH